MTRFKKNLTTYKNRFQNIGTHFERWEIGILGPVTLKGLNSGTWDMSKWKWTYKVCFLHCLLIYSSMTWTDTLIRCQYKYTGWCGRWSFESVHCQRKLLSQVDRWISISNKEALNMVQGEKQLCNIHDQCSKNPRLVPSSLNFNNIFDILAHTLIYI